MVGSGIYWYVGTYLRGNQGIPLYDVMQSYGGKDHCNCLKAGEKFIYAEAQSGANQGKHRDQ